MWIKITLFTSLFILGSAYILNDVVGVPKSLECEDNKADIAFIIDSSRSIYPPDFDKGIDFLVDFMQIFTIGPDHVRVAAVAFGKRVITDSAFGFNKYDTKVASLQALKGIKFRPELGGSTNTAMAIAYALKQFFAHARPTVKKIAIVLTDGKSDNPVKTKAEAELLRSQGAEITAIGVGSSVITSELNDIASSPDNVFKVNSYGALKNIIRKLGILTCKMTTKTSALQLKAGLTTIAAPTTLTTTTPTTTTTTTTPLPKQEHSAFGFNKFHTKAENIKFRPQLGRVTNTAMAIAYACKQFFANARPNVKKIAIVLTNSRSDNFVKTKTEAEMLKNQGVDIIVIGVGQNLMKAELIAIASSPQNVIEVNNYGALKYIRVTFDSITRKTCNGQAIDFNFVFDPAQMGTSGTEEAIRFIKTVVSVDDLNNGKVRFGTITGPCPPTIGFHLNSYSDFPDILNHLDTYRRTDMASLITDLRSKAFESKNGGRENARKVGVVFLKGKLSNPDLAMVEAKLAQTKGIEIFIVDTGSLNQESVLESIVSRKKSNILRATDSSEIIKMAQTLVSQICTMTFESDC